MSLNESLGIPNERATAISKIYAERVKPIYEKGRMSESGCLEIIAGMDLTDTERLWLAYHVGGVNRMILYGKATAKQIIINW